MKDTSMTLAAIKDELEGQILSESADRITVRPKDLSAAAKLVRLAAEHDHKLIPVGGGSKRHWLDGSNGPCIELDMRSCCRVVEYSPDDMTITVEAGIVLAELAAVLAANKQRIILDPPTPTQATIGGVLASNDSGPIRFGWGKARDIVIGMSVIATDGEFVHSGGKVVKNVAGYDLHKLHIGAFGTLGPIATVTFRLHPLPEARGLVLLQPPNADDAERMLAAILAGPTRPTLIELLNARMAKSLDLAPRLTLVVGFEENADAVKWECEQLRKALAADVLDAPGSEALYANLREAAAASAEVSFKATVPSSDVPAYVASAERLCGGIRIIARAGNGTVYGLLGAAAPKPAWTELESLAAEAGGSLHIRGPLPASDLRRFGRPRSDAHLTRAIQRAFDPKGTFAPERVGYLG